MEDLAKKKKDVAKAEGSMTFLITGAIGLVVATVVITFGADIVQDFQGDYTSGTSAYNVTIEGQSANSKFASKLPLVASVVIIVGIIALLVRGLAGFFQS